MTSGSTDASIAALRRFHQVGLAASEIAEFFQCTEEVIVKRMQALGLRPHLTPSDTPTTEAQAFVSGPEVVKACNCACCRNELRSVWRGTVCVRSCVAGYVLQRPYCFDCLPMAQQRFTGR